MAKKSTDQNSTMIWLHWTGVIYVSLIAFVLVIMTLGAMIQYLPWWDIVINTSSGGMQMGPNLQIGVTALMLVLLVYLPASMRVLRLEAAHRDFNLTMNDVSKAYIASHEADRAGLFNLSSEFDSVRERINHMRDHPELSKLEPAVLDVAAQMSHTSRDIAQIYSDEAVNRAKTILRQRQMELEEFTDTLSMARRQTDEIRRWSQQLEVEGNVADTQLSQLKMDLGEILPTLGLKVIRGPKVQPKSFLDQRDEPAQIEQVQDNILTIESDDKKSSRSDKAAAE